MSNFPIKIGLNARLFQNNWRPVLQEIEFAQTAGFQAIQQHGSEDGLNEEALGSSFPDILRSLHLNKITPVMEIMVHVESNGKTTSNKSPLEILQANMPAITQLECRHVHWHLVPNSPKLIDDYFQFESSLIPQFEKAVELARNNGFYFGIEHNEPEFRMFGSPKQSQRILEAVKGLAFVWDINHTTTEDYPLYMDLLPRLGMLHISDTLLPEVNYHLPIGQGNIIFSDYFEVLTRGGFQGIGILEIGGLPKSGGYGRDTDEALIDSLCRINEVIGKALYNS